MVINRNSCWQGWRKGVLCNFMVIGIWGTGSAANYQAKIYELQPAGSDEAILVERGKIIEMIEEGLLKRIDG
jgi:hypothetical protein